MVKYLFLSCLILAGCSQSDTSSNTTPVRPARASTAQDVPTPDLCELVKAGVNNLDVKSVLPPEMITIERHYQQVVRKDCAGRITSDKVETVKDPHYNLTLQASSNRKYKAIFLLNKTTCDHVLASMPITNLPLFGLLYSVTGSDQGQTHIKADIANAVLTFHLAEGWNELYVRYYYDCSPKNVEGETKVRFGTGTCDVSADSRLEKHNVHVKYVVKNLDGVKEILPSEEECQKQNKR